MEALKCQGLLARLAVCLARTQSRALVRPLSPQLFRTLAYPDVCIPQSVERLVT